MRRTAQVAVLLLVAATVSHGLVRAYGVEPVSAQLSGWTDTLSQTVTCCWDQLDRGEFRGHNKRLLTGNGPSVEYGCGTMGTSCRTVCSSPRHAARDKAAAGVLQRRRL